MSANLRLPSLLMAMTYNTGIEMAMMEAAGSVNVQMVRSTRSYVISGLVMLTTRTALTIPVMPALYPRPLAIQKKEKKRYRLQETQWKLQIENEEEPTYIAPRLMAMATPTLSRRRIETPMMICHGKNARTKSRMAE